MKMGEFVKSARGEERHFDGRRENVESSITTILAPFASVEIDSVGILSVTIC